VRILIDTETGRGSLEWEATSFNDMIADAAIALAMEAESSPVTLKMSSTPCCAHRKVACSAQAQDQNQDQDQTGLARLLPAPGHSIKGLSSHG
jgi:hypothetical protein